MTVNNMRDALKKRYSPVIQGKNVDTMPEKQVIAIYRSLIERKDPLISNPNRKIPKKMRLHEPVRYEQLRMEI